MYINKVQLYGRLGKDPEKKATTNGTIVASFSLATTREWKKDGRKVEETEWHNCTIFGKRAEAFCQWVKKGDKVLIEGHLKTDHWEDKDGNKRSRTGIMVDDFFFGDNPKKKDSDSKPASAPQNESELIDYPTDDINPEDIPF